MIIDFTVNVSGTGELGSVQDFFDQVGHQTTKLISWSNILHRFFFWNVRPILDTEKWLW